MIKEVRSCKWCSAELPKNYGRTECQNCRSRHSKGTVFLTGETTDDRYEFMRYKRQRGL